MAWTDEVDPTVANLRKLVTEKWAVDREYHEALRPGVETTPILLDRLWQRCEVAESRVLEVADAITLAPDEVGPLREELARVQAEVEGLRSQLETLRQDFRGHLNARYIYNP